MRFGGLPSVVPLTATPTNASLADDVIAPEPVAMPAAELRPTVARPESSAWQRVSRLFAAPLLLAVVFQNIANFGFHAVVGRVLPADEYGALGSVLALMVLLSVPLTALQAAASASVSGAWDSRGVRSSLRRTLGAGALVGIVVAVAAPLAQGYFHLASRIDALVLAPFITVSLVLAVVRGLLLGDGKVATTALTYVTGTAGRFALGVALVLRFGVTGALVGTLLGELIALMTGLAPTLRRRGRARGAGRLVLSDVGVSGFAVTGLFLFSTVDLLLARHYLAGGESGSYVAAATIGKTVLALPAAVIGVYYPRLVAGWRAGDVRVLARAVAVVVGLGFAAASIVALAAPALLHLLFGAGAFSNAAPLVRLLAVVAGLTSIVSVLTYAALARRGRSVIVVWIGAALEFGLIATHHASAIAVARASLVSLVPVLVVLAVWEGRVWWRSGHVAPVGRHERNVPS